MTEQEARALLEEGRRKADAGDTEEALVCYRRAVELVAEPFDEQEIATELISAIGDAHFARGEFKEAHQAFEDAMLCPGGPQNAHVGLRRGQTAFELGEMKSAKVQLACAYMNAGKEIFDGEDPKYWEFIAPVMREALGNEMVD